MKKKLATILMLLLMAVLLRIPVGMAAGADPSNLAAIETTSTSIRMTWSDNVTDEDYYRIYRRINNGTWTIIQWKYTSADYTDTGLTPNTTYAYQVQAIKEVSGVPHYDQAPSNILTVTTPKDPTPTNLQATVKSTSSIKLTWQKNTSDADYYRVDRRTGTAAFAVVKWDLPGDSSSWTDTGLKASTTYKYRVYAIRMVSGTPHYYGSYSNEASATTMAAASALKAPTNFTAVAVSSSQINLSWTDNASAEAGFSVERKKKGSSTFTVIDSLPANTTSYSDKGLASSTTYTYRVQATSTNESLNSPYSNEASATTSKEAVNPPASSTTVLKFYIGSNEYYVNGQVQTMDSAPVVLENRTLLPITYAATPLGVSVNWIGPERKVTLTRQGTTINLWIDQSIAKVNGVDTYIDPANLNVAPRVINNRTMLPISFIAANLNCLVEWNPNTREVKITYPQP